jgi:hypothetical protein
MWTPTALASETKPAAGTAWRVVEHQHTVSTRKLVDSLAEQEVLEDILEASKPRYPPAAAQLHYLLKTPFRYFPPATHGSRFRRPFDGRGVFYCAEAIRTALAEFAYWRRRFIGASPGTPLPRHQESLTVFSVAYAARRLIDLTGPPFDRDRPLWTHPHDYAVTQALADAARSVDIDAIRYESVRDPERGMNLALLAPGVFARKSPLAQQTWYLYLGASEANCMRAGRAGEVFTFVAEQ